MDDYFLNAASIFLSCCIAEFPFKFLGIPMGVSPRRCSTWSPVVDIMKKRLSTWTGRHVSIGGRVTSINSVLTSMPLDFFSFHKH